MIFYLQDKMGPIQFEDMWMQIMQVTLMIGGLIKVTCSHN